MTPESRGVAVVSGGGSGIGREIALALARRGHPLALLGRRTALLESTLSDAGVVGGDRLALACDVRDADSVAAAAREVERRWGAAAIVVPAAGLATIAPLEETAPDRFRDLLETNLTGTFLLLHALLPGMKRRGSGWIFPILSTAAQRGFPGWSAYCASKWGLAGLVAALREELRGSGIRVTALYPGATDSPLWDELPGDWNRALMVPPREVARAVVNALESDPSTLVEEIHLGPVGGAL
jgi:NAD(P)-dependent dehydrogenase (short-subunit alcohol dehydrogenase family)